MKKIIAMLLALVMLLSLAACASSGENTPLPLDAILKLLHGHHFLSKVLVLYCFILPDF